MTGILPRMGVKTVKAIPIALAFSIAVPSIAVGDVVHLQALEDRAVARSPAIRAARAGIGEAEAHADEAASARVPTLGLRADASIAPGGQLVEVLGAETERTTYEVMAAPSLGDADAFDPVPRFGLVAGARWRALDFGRSAAAEHAAGLGAEAGALGAQAAEQEIRMAVRRAYLAWTVAGALHAIAREGMTAAEERAARVQRLISAEQRPASDGAALAVDVSTARLEQARAAARLAAARSAVEGTVGEALPEGATPDPAMIDDAPEASTDDPIGRSIEARRAAASAMADSHSYRYRPVLDVEADVGMRGQADSQFPVYRGAVVFSLPVFDGGVGSARERAARAEAERLGAEREAHRQRRDAEHAMAQTEAQNARETGEAAHALVQAAEERLAAAEAAYDQGVGSTDLIAAARETLRRARTEELLSRADLAEARLR